MKPVNSIQEMTVTHARRREHLAALLPAHEADAILVTHGVNVRYLTGLDSSNAAVLVRADATRDAGHRPRYTETARRICSDIEVIEERDVAGGLVSRARRIGVEADHLSVADYFRLGEDLLRVSGMVEAVRLVKDEAEIDLIRTACGLTDRAPRRRAAHPEARTDREGDRQGAGVPDDRAGRGRARLRLDRGERPQRLDPAPLALRPAAGAR